MAKSRLQLHIRRARGYDTCPLPVEISLHQEHFQKKMPGEEGWLLLFVSSCVVHLDEVAV